MPAASPGSPRHTGFFLFLVAAIPFTSVTLAARVGDTAVSNSAGDAVGSLLALSVGVGTGLLGARIARVVRCGISAVAVTLMRSVARVAALAPNAGCSAWMPVGEVPTAHRAFVPAEVGRRGPPSRLR